MDRSDQTDRDRSDQADQWDLTKLNDHQRWQLYSPWLDHPDTAVRANAVICIIHQANFLLDQQLDALEQRFINEGGYSEQLATARLNKRAEARVPKRDGSATPQAPPLCPYCGALMALRTAKAGKNAGGQFWGCTGYPKCNGTAEV